MTRMEKKAGQGRGGGKSKVQGPRLLAILMGWACGTQSQSGVPLGRELNPCEN